MSSQKKSSRLEGKDLITIGIYTVIYVVIVMLVAMLGFIPVFIPLMAVLCPLIGGIPYMLYVTKAKKFGMTAIMGFLIGLIMVFFGNGYKHDRRSAAPPFQDTRPCFWRCPDTFHHRYAHTG